MSNQTPAGEPDVSPDTEIDGLLYQLRSKLKTFVIKNKHGFQVGKVNDLFLDRSRQLNLVVSQSSQEDSRLFLLKSRLIQEVDPSTQSLLVDVTQTEIERLPDYRPDYRPETPVETALPVSDSPTSVGVANDQSAENHLLGTALPEEMAEAVIRLLEERLVVTHSRRKVGEVVVRKVVETQMVKVPIRQEKLIVEQVSLKDASEELVNLKDPSSSAPFAPSVTESDNNQPVENHLLKTALPEETAEAVIRLLSERLVVTRSKRKVGEVVARKVVETRLVEVPVRREKLIVEQVSPEHKQLLEIDLSQEASSDAEQTPISTPDDELTVGGEFASLKAAGLLLDAIALQRRHGCSKVRVEIVLEDPQQQERYQAWFDRCSGNPLK